MQTLEEQTSRAFHKGSVAAIAKPFILSLSCVKMNWVKKSFSPVTAGLICLDSPEEIPSL